LFVPVLVRAVSAQPALRVERILDGETLVVAGVGTVRLLGVDVPRTVDAQRPADEGADRAVVLLRKLLADQTVRLEYDVERIDSASRPLAYVYLSTGALLNAELLKEGLGRANPDVPFKMLEEFQRYEREARAQRRGLWATDSGPGDAAPVPRPPSPPGAPMIR
jgi:micrococcal nuclease